MRVFVLALAFAILPAITCQDESVSNFVPSSIDSTEGKKPPSAYTTTNLNFQVEKLTSPPYKKFEDSAKDTMPTTVFYTGTETTTSDSMEEEVTTGPYGVYKEIVNPACPGQCIIFHISDYCEAYLTLPDRCSSGYRCCVSEQDYRNTRPSDLVVPGVNKQLTSESTKELSITTPGLKSSSECRGECNSPLIAIMCEDKDYDATCPSDEVCCISKAPKTTTLGPTSGRQCQGECLSGLFAMMCANVDEHTTCPKDSLCCKFNASDTGNVPPRRTSTTARSTIYAKRTTALQKTSGHQCQGGCIDVLYKSLCARVDYDADCPAKEICCPSATQPTTRPMSTITPETFTTLKPITIEPPRRCLGLCLPTFASGLCIYPANVMPGTQCALQSYVCCDLTQLVSLLQIAFAN